jgi:thiol:disulfide interchange protein
MEVCLETREDLVDLLKCSTYEYIVLKFKAEWCKPCKVIDPFIHNLVDDKINVLNKQNRTNVFLYVEIDIDVCTDLYIFLKKMKRLNGVPSVLFYQKSIYDKIEDDYKYIPQQSISGANESAIQKLFDRIQ